MTNIKCPVIETFKETRLRSLKNQTEMTKGFIKATHNEIDELQRRMRTLIKREAKEKKILASLQRETNKIESEVFFEKAKRVSK